MDNTCTYLSFTSRNRIIKISTFLLLLPHIVVYRYNPILKTSKMYCKERIKVQFRILIIFKFSTLNVRLNMPVTVLSVLIIILGNNCLRTRRRLSCVTKTNVERLLSDRKYPSVFIPCSKEILYCTA